MSAIDDPGDNCIACDKAKPNRAFVRLLDWHTCRKCGMQLFRIYKRHERALKAGRNCDCPYCRTSVAAIAQKALF